MFFVAIELEIKKIFGKKKLRKEQVLLLNILALFGYCSVSRSNNIQFFLNKRCLLSLCSYIGIIQGWSVNSEVGNMRAF